MNSKNEKTTLQDLGKDCMEIFENLKQDGKVCGFMEILLHTRTFTVSRAKLIKLYEENFESLKTDFSVPQKAHPEFFFTNKVTVGVVYTPEEKIVNYKVRIDTTVGVVPSKHDVIHYMRQYRSEMLHNSPVIRTLVHLLNDPEINDAFENPSKGSDFFRSLLKGEGPLSLQEAFRFLRKNSVHELAQIRFNSLKHAGVGEKLPEGPAIAICDFSNLPPSSAGFAMLREGVMRSLFGDITKTEAADKKLKPRAKKKV